MSTRTTAVTYEEADLLVSALKRYELAFGDGDVSRMLVARFRRMRDELMPPADPVTAESEAAIFAAADGASPL